MILINGGLPRSGTVLVGTILSALCLRSGLTVHRHNPGERRDMPALATAIATHQGPDVLLVHTHLTSSDVIAALAGRPRAVVLWNRRDPRDALVSLMRLHDMSLADGLRAMTIYLEHLEMMDRVAGVHRLLYEEIVTDPVGLVCQLAHASGLDCDTARATEIAEATSPEAHRRIMSDIRAGAREATVIRTLRRTMREDPLTLVNDRHIQSGRAGRWKDELDDRAQARVTEALAPWLVRLGYLQQR